VFDPKKRANKKNKLGNQNQGKKQGKNKKTRQQDKQEKKQKNRGKCRCCLFFFLLFFFLVTLPVEFFFGDSVFDCDFVFCFFAKINFLCSTRGYKSSQII
jgi:hypothetical protein